MGEHFTFGELKVGDRFICFPILSDENGRVGLKKAHYIFIKTVPMITHGNDKIRAVQIRSGIPAIMPNNTPVILVE